MAKIEWERTEFLKPRKINEQTYLNLKKEFEINQNFEIFEKTKSFSEKFQTHFVLIVISFIIISILLTLESKLIVLRLLIGIAFMTFFWSIIYLFLEGPSYATYVKKKTEYSDKMNYAIQNSRNYTEFCNMLY
jgi:hypothetical protein